MDKRFLVQVSYIIRRLYCYSNVTKPHLQHQNRKKVFGIRTMVTAAFAAAPLSAFHAASNANEIPPLNANNVPHLYPPHNNFRRFAKRTSPLFVAASSSSSEKDNENLKASSDDGINDQGSPLFQADYFEADLDDIILPHDAASLEVAEEFAQLEEFLNQLEEDNDNNNDEHTFDVDEAPFWEKDSLLELLNEIDDESDDADKSSRAAPMADSFEKSTSTAATLASDMNTSDSPEESEAMLELRSIQARVQRAAVQDLESALLDGVVPATAGVGSDCLPGDWGFDPLELSNKDYFCRVQNILTACLSQSGQPAPRNDQEDGIHTQRPRALILRDYREAEIRHGRLAMLAAMFWPLQELLDRFVLGRAQPLLYADMTLPYFPLLMTAIMLFLGYLDIYSKEIKEADQVGEAFLPGDCFWDPLRILQSAPANMQRNMQERELLNGRVAMLAVAAFLWEEGLSHHALVDIPGNELLLEPAYQVSFIQEWLDKQFVPMTSGGGLTIVPSVDGGLDDLLDELIE